MAKKSKEVITAIEIGTSAIKIFMGEPQEDGSMTVLASQERPHSGKVIKGEVTNVSAVAEALGDALNTVESMSGRRITLVYLAITGGHIGSTNVRGTVPITAPDRVITEDDVVAASRHARATNFPIGQEAIHSFQRSFYIDGDRKTGQPVGMMGNQLTADIHFVYGGVNNIQTMYQIADSVLGFPPNDVVFSCIADFYAVAPIDGTQQNGLLLIDIGAGVTEYVLFYNSNCMHSGQITVGCEHVANDIAIGLHLPIGKAREIIRKHGAAIGSSADNQKKIKIEMSIGHPPRVFKLSTLQTIIELRMRELFEIIYADLKEHDVAQLISEKIVLCGGGALIPQAPTLAAEVFSVPAHIGYPINVSGPEAEVNSPRSVTPIGLLQVGERLRQIEQEPGLPFKEVVKRDINRFVDLFRRAVRF